MKDFNTSKINIQLRKFERDSKRVINNYKREIKKLEHDFKIEQSKMISELNNLNIKS